MTKPTSQVFVSAINGAKMDVTNALTAQLLSKNEKKEIIQKQPPTPTKATKGKTSDNEQEIG